MRSHLLIGASHALYMAQALGHVEADLNQASAGAVPIDVPASEGRFKLLLLSGGTQFLSFSHRDGGLRVHANEVLLRELRAHNHPDAQAILLINGNEHNARFMQTHAQPFDFSHPQLPGLIAGRQTVPAAAVRDALDDSLALTRLTTAFLAQRLPLAAKVFIAPPPPIPSEAQIRRQPEGFDFSQRTVEDARLRLKIYALYLERLGHAVNAAGVTLLAPPPDTRDAEGFLRECHWFHCTHANAAYYAPVWQALGVNACAAASASV